MVNHCFNWHGKLGEGCKVRGCVVRMGTKREKELHVHFCHELPTGNALFFIPSN